MVKVVPLASAQRSRDRSDCPMGSGV